jgi:hypothetical protein
MKTIYFAASSALIILTLHTHAQCSIPNGAKKLETGVGAAIDFATVTNVSQTYYVPAGITVNVNHSGGALSIGNSGTILVLENAQLNINMGVNNFTVGGGTIFLCAGAKVNITPGHDFTLQNNSDITLSSFSSFNMCNFGHDITFNGGNVNMSDFSSFEISNYHNFVTSSANVVKYTGTGSVGIASGNPLVHTTGTDFVTYSNTNAFSQNLTASTHVDFINDAHGGDKPGSANYCGPMAGPNNLACRSAWAAMNFACGSAAAFLQNFYVLPLDQLGLESKTVGNFLLLNWSVANGTKYDYFEIQELTSSPPATIKRIVAHDSPSSHSIYSFQQENVNAGTHFYRLKAVEEQGKVTYTATVKVVINPPNGGIDAVYDASKHDLLVYANAGNDKDLTIRVYTVGGQQLYTQYQHAVTAGLTQIKLNCLQQGMQIVTITNGTQTKVLKIIGP